jgi:hypothetical protein
MKTKNLAEEITTLKKLEKFLDDVQNFKNANQNLSQIIRDMEIKREIINKTR